MHTCAYANFYVYLRGFWGNINVQLETMKKNGLHIRFCWITAIMLFISLFSFRAQADEVVAIKNNLLYDATATPNLQLEFKLAPKWSLELGAGFNPFPLDDTKFPKWRHLSAWLAPRYWFCNVFNKGFISANVAYAHYNVAGSAYPVSWMYKQVKESRYEGDAVLAGLSFGWHFPITHYFSIELEGGVDAGYSWYKQYECRHCGDLTDENGRWAVLPKLGVNLSFPLGGNKETLAKRCDCEKLATSAEEATEEATEETAEEQPAEEVTEQPVEEVTEQPAEQTQPTEEQPVEQAQPTEEVTEQPVEQTQPAEEVGEQPVEQTQPVEEVAAEPTQPAEQPVVVEEEEPVNREPVAETVSSSTSVTKETDSSKLPSAPKKNKSWNPLLVPEYEYGPFDPTIPLSADKRNVFVYFDVDETKMDPDFFKNANIMDNVMRVIGETLEDPNLRITHIRIVGFASFDGSIAHNNNLAKNRAATIKKYIQSQYTIDDKVFDVVNGGESWTELQYNLDLVDFEGREDVQSIIESEQNADNREKQIKQLKEGDTYRHLRDNQKPILRNLGCITIFCENVE